MNLNNHIYLSHSIPAIHQKLINREISALELAQVTIDNIEKYESDIKAWVDLDLKKLIENAKAADRMGQFDLPGRLSGIPLGVKDIFNTKEYKTQMGSSLWSGFQPGNNARVVDYLIWAGGIVAGKTNTAEFAVHHLNETKNPHNPLHTPGTSSSGSAAAVAIGMVPFALATQTAGSITRPASFCGVWGYKPSFGLLPRTGILKTTDSLDTVGFISSHGLSLRPILDAVRVKGPNFPYVYESVDKGSRILNSRSSIRVGFVKTYAWNAAQQYVKDELTDFVSQLDGLPNYNVEVLDWPSDLDSVHQVHDIIYKKSLSYYFQREAKFKGGLSAIMAEMIEQGEVITLESFRAALKEQDRICKRVNEIFEEYDLIISLGTGSSAPLRGDIEVDDPSLIWTLAHVPTISIPLFRSPSNLPFSLQFTGKKWSDYSLLNIIENLIERDFIVSGPMPIKNFPNL